MSNPPKIDMSALSSLVGFWPAFRKWQEDRNPRKISFFAGPFILFWQFSMM